MRTDLFSLHATEFPGFGRGKIDLPPFYYLEQAVRRILLNGCYEGVTTETGEDEESSLATDIRAGSLTATDLLSRYCRALYARMGSYEQVARHIDLDRRTVKKYIEHDAS